jgi:tRNA1(Val) A37 N6-methylase TrmN6
MMDVTRDQFLGGQLLICQPRDGYRAGVDPVLLAASVPAKAGQSVLELGCGVGVGVLALGRRVAGLDLTGLEIQPDYAEMARENAAYNGLSLTVVTGDLEHMPTPLRSKSFDHVIANPPYFDRQKSTPARDNGRERAMGEQTELGHWVGQAAKRLAPRGHAHFIFRSERLIDLLAAIPPTCGSVVITPIVPRMGKDATLVIVHFRKSGRAAPRIESPLIMHKGEVHVSDAKDYTECIENVLRQGHALTNWYR